MAMVSLDCARIPPDDCWAHPILKSECIHKRSYHMICSVCGEYEMEKRFWLLFLILIWFIRIKLFTWPINSSVCAVRAVDLLLWWHFDRPGKWAAAIAIRWCMPDKMHAHIRLPVMVPLIHRHKSDTLALHRHRLEIVSIHNPFSFNLIRLIYTHTHTSARTHIRTHIHNAGVTVHSLSLAFNDASSIFALLNFSLVDWIFFSSAINERENPVDESLSSGLLSFLVWKRKLDKQYITSIESKNCHNNTIKTYYILCDNSRGLKIKSGRQNCCG